jgi:8-oxo-dGTP pyrophosphatase MutT (NUDIX family)
MRVSHLQTALDLIPSHRERSLTHQALVERMASASGLASESAAPVVEVTLDLLNLLDLVDKSDEHIRLAGQTQTYCRNCLLWYLQNGQQVLSNWQRNGTARDDISIANLLDQAPYFLKALEERRQAIAIAANLPLPASREQRCSIVLVKISRDGKTYLLHQWDQEAERYQLIGGKQRNNETPEQTAMREFGEEVSEKTLVPGKNLLITRSQIPEIVEIGISKTYGALTKYHISVFQASLNVATFRTSEADRWLSIDEFLAGTTLGGVPIAPLASSIARVNPGFLEALPASLDFNGPLHGGSETDTRRIRARSTLPTEPPSHLSLEWIWKLVWKLSLHDLAILFAALTFIVGASFAAGKFYEHFQADRTHERALSNTDSHPPSDRPPVDDASSAPRTEPLLPK